MIRLRYALFLILSYAFAASAQDGVTLPDATRIELDNGVVLLINEKHDVPLVGMTALLRGGTSADPDGMEGLASLVAGLIERGAGERSAAEFAEAIEAVGGGLNAGAEMEFVAVKGDFMARDANLMIELLADMLQRPALDRNELDKLRERRINLIRSAKDANPGELMSDYFSASLFGEHPYGNPTTGSEESLARISHQDITTWYAEHIGADRLVIAVSGDINADDMIAALTAAFGEWRPASIGPRVVEAPVKQAANRVLLIDKPGATQSYFWIGNVGVARDFAARADLNVTNTVFGGRFSSMLNSALRIESGLTYGARSRLERLSQPGYFAMTSYTRTDATIEAIDMALGVLGQLRDSGLDETMVGSAQNYIMGQFPTLLETSAQLADLFASFELYGLGRDYIDDYGNAIAAVTVESVATVIDEVYPQAHELVFVIIGDAEQIREAVSKYGPVTEMSITEPRFSP